MTEMPDTITILGQKLKLIVPDDGGPYYETADEESTVKITAWPPGPYLDWEVTFPVPQGIIKVRETTLEKVEVALTARLKEYQDKTVSTLSAANRLLNPLRTRNLERGPDTLVVNGITLTKYKTNLYGRCLEEKYRSCPLFVLERNIDSEYPATKLWRVFFETREVDGWTGKWCSNPEEALDNALGSAQGYVEDTQEDIENLQERKKYFENLAVSLGFKEAENA